MSSANELKLFKCLPIPPGNIDDIFELQAIRMAILHNIIIRSYNSILYYSGQVKPGTKEYNAFLAYCAIANMFVHHHHEHEEDLYFPFLESKLGTGKMSGNVSGHDNFRRPFAAFEDLLADLQSGKVQWDPAKFRETIYSFTEPLFEHLGEEIDTLRADVLREHFTKEDFVPFEKAMEKRVMESTSLPRDPPLLFINGDGVNGAWFPPMPPPVTWVVKNVLWHFNAPRWQFGSCDKFMKVKPEFAAYEPELEVAKA
ncbi:hypothetical protein FRB99_000162 [Tulasnella sp. 403]|nr:hypothetical protein FRB99_000162 [Tulasnella sp. 403]